MEEEGAVPEVGGRAAVSARRSPPLLCGLILPYEVLTPKSGVRLSFGRRTDRWSILIACRAPNSDDHKGLPCVRMRFIRFMRKEFSRSMSSCRERRLRALLPLKPGADLGLIGEKRSRGR